MMGGQLVSPEQDPGRPWPQQIRVVPSAPQSRPPGVHTFPEQVPIHSC